VSEECSSAGIPIVSGVPQQGLVDDQGLELGLVELLVEGGNVCVDLVVAAVQLPDHPSRRVTAAGFEAVS